MVLKWARSSEMSGIFDPLGDMLAGLADVIADFLP